MHHNELLDAVHVPYKRGHKFNKRSYFCLLFAALALVLSSVVGIEYYCLETAIYPSFYGMPFIYKQKSLGSSMEFYYCISGVFMNVLMCFFLLQVIWQAFVRMVERNLDEAVGRRVCQFVASAVLFLSTLEILTVYLGIGDGFAPMLNYWYWDIDQFAKDSDIHYRARGYLFH